MAEPPAPPSIAAPLETIEHMHNPRYMEQHALSLSSPSSSPPVAHHQDLPISSAPPAVPPKDQLPVATQQDDGSKFLTSLLMKTLRVTTRDMRMFVGGLRCTDKDRNLILTSTHEYRYPEERELQNIITTSTTPLGGSVGAGGDDTDKVTLELRSRYLGLVVVPGEDIVKIEVEV